MLLGGDCVTPSHLLGQVDHLQVDHDIEYLVPHLLLREAVQNLHGICLVLNSGNVC